MAVTTTRTHHSCCCTNAEGCTQTTEDYSEFGQLSCTPRVAQGGANIVNGLFGGMGGCAMIGQSIINVNSGGRGRLSGIIAAITLLCFVLFGAPLIEQIPIAALVVLVYIP